MNVGWMPYEHDPEPLSKACLLFPSLTMYIIHYSEGIRERAYVNMNGSDGW